MWDHAPVYTMQNLLHWIKSEAKRDVQIKLPSDSNIKNWKKIKRKNKKRKKKNENWKLKIEKWKKANVNHAYQHNYIPLPIRKSSDKS